MINQFRIVPTLQGWRLQSTRCAIHIINLLIWVGCPVAIGLWSSSPPVQASACEHISAQTTQESKSLEPGNPLNESSLAANRIPTKSG